MGVLDTIVQTAKMVYASCVCVRVGMHACVHACCSSTYTPALYALDAVGNPVQSDPARTKSHGYEVPMATEYLWIPRECP